jgi:hypothetical protein
MVSEIKDPSLFHQNASDGEKGLLARTQGGGAIKLAFDRRKL